MKINKAVYLILITVLFFVSTNICCAQRIDTIFDMGIYKSYFNYELEEPVYVVYKLYKAGGEKCSRASMSFKNDTKIKMATHQDYDGSGYDIGHMADAADYSSNCEKEEKTFRFYNALPQTPELNRGIWKAMETKVRELSHTDSLLVICGGEWNVYTGKKIGDIHVPQHCWKVVEDLVTDEIVYCSIFTNNEAPIEVPISVKILEEQLGYKLPLHDK